MVVKERKGEGGDYGVVERSQGGNSMEIRSDEKARIIYHGERWLTFKVRLRSLHVRADNALAH